MITIKTLTNLPESLLRTLGYHTRMLRSIRVNQLAIFLPEMLVSLEAPPFLVKRYVFFQNR